jgi:D-sedoheptulose 7-phosphate isomerase
MEWNEYKNLIQELLNSLEFDKEILEILKNSIKNNQTIFIIGNGGSAAIASHYACDLSKGAIKNWKENLNRYKVIPLTVNLPYISAISNDDDYSEIFKQQLINLFKPNDILIAISSSGKSRNIIKAVEFANINGMITIGISGFDGGELKKIAKYNVHVKSNCIEAVEDIHSIFGHFLAIFLRSIE